MQRYIKMRTKQNNSHFFLYYSRFAVSLHPQNVIKMKDICCIGHVTKDKIVLYVKKLSPLGWLN